MKKRIISLCLALILTLSMIPTAAAAGAGFKNFEKINAYVDGLFSDVSAGAWFAENVSLAYELGLMKGVSENSFNPDGSITLAEAIALAARLHSIYNGKGGEFEQGEPWYTVYVQYAQDNGITNGVDISDLTACATRSMFAQIFANALPAKALKAINKIADGAIADVPSAADFSDAVYKLYNAGILTGSDEHGTFHPNSNITRAEISAIVTRMANESLRKKIDLVITDAVDQITAQERVDFAAFVSTYTEAMKAINDLASLWNGKLQHPQFPVPVEYLEQVVDYLLDIQVKFMVLEESYGQYEYMAHILELMREEIADIEKVLERPVSSHDGTQFLFMFECEMCLTGLFEHASQIADELISLSETIFAE